jgi:parallel beta-helix repeat protein
MDAISHGDTPARMHGPRKRGTRRVRANRRPAPVKDPCDYGAGPWRAVPPLRPVIKVSNDEGNQVVPVKLRHYAAPATLVLLAAMVALAAASPMAVGGGRPLASHVSCGDTITADTTLDGDLVNCPNHGIVIAADEITLDLNGHQIDGDGAPAVGCDPQREYCDRGVLNDGHDGITVRDGSVRDFEAGVVIKRARQNRVLNVSSSTNQFNGFVIADSARSLVRDSSGNGNPAPDGDGIGVFRSRHLRILDNAFRRNARGMHVEDSTNLIIKNNRLAGNSGPGILMQADRNQVRGNRCVRNGVRNHACIILRPGSRNTIAQNRSFHDGGGILIEGGRGNLVARNVVARARRDGIRLGFREPPIRGANNAVRGNVVRGSGADGFAVAEHDRHSLLGRNIAIGAGDDGFDVQSRSTKLTGNRAMRNADLGIEAVRGVIDGGGNIARRNRNPRRCTHVSCK